MRWSLRFLGCLKVTSIDVLWFNTSCDNDDDDDDNDDNDDDDDDDEEVPEMWIWPIRSLETGKLSLSFETLIDQSAKRIKLLAADDDDDDDNDNDDDDDDDDDEN